MERNPLQLSFSVQNFCRVHDMSRSQFYELRKLGLAPRLFYIGRKPLISAESAAEWRARMQDLAAGREAA